MSLRVAVAQFQPRSSYSHCLQLIQELLSNVSIMYTDDTRPEVIVFAELFLGGYHNEHLFYEHAIDVLASKADPDSTLSVICAAAKSHGIALCFGYVEKVEVVEALPAETAKGTTKTCYYNSVIFVSGDGEVLANYRKTHLWGDCEKKWFAPGDQLGPVFSYKGLRIALLVCFDVEFPETCRTLRQMGAQLVIVPTALVSRFNAKITVPSRAAENGIFIAYANEIGEVESLTSKHRYAYCGSSCVVGPDGEDIARCAGLEDRKDEDEVRTAAIVADDPKYIAAVARNPYLDSLRPELYQF